MQKYQKKHILQSFCHIFREKLVTLPKFFNLTDCKMKKTLILITGLLFAASIAVFATDNNKGATATISYTSSISKDLAGEWSMRTLRNKEINTRERAYLVFNFTETDSLIYGNNGCNVINGTIHTHGANKISFVNMLTTMAECHNSTSERSIMKALNEVTAYKISTQNGIRYLTLMNAKGQNLIYLKNQDINFLNGAWTVSSINEESMTSKNVRIVIDIQEMKIHGNSGCNLFNGTLFIDPDKDWAVEFQELVSTRKMCPDINIETALLVALEETQTCKKLTSNEIALYDGAGKQVATLRRLNLR